MAGQEEAFLTCVCYQAYVAAAAKEKMEQQLKETGMFSLFSEIEMPLVKQGKHSLLLPIWKTKASSPVEMR